MPSPGKKIISLLILVAALGGAFWLGVYAGQTQIPAIERVTGLYNKETAKPPTVDFSPFWEAWVVLEERFVPENGTTTPISDEQKVWGAIKGLAGSLNDPHTVYLPPSESEIFQQDISGNFEGVGMEVAIRDGILTVIAPLKGSPAERAGLRSGDQILKIDGRLTANLTIEEAIVLIRGPRGSVVSLLILRNGGEEPLEIKVVRDVIQIPTIESEEITRAGQKIFVIRLYNFSASSISLFRRALIKFADSETDKLIIDLRGNAGGFLEAAVDIASWFLPEGKVVVREVGGLGQEQKEKIHRSRGYDIFTEALKLVILIDQGSASASEIFAGALGEHGKATLVGAKTFGKGSVQELVELEGGGAIKVTISRWLTPQGESLSKGGLEPDIAVARSQEDFEALRDPQFDRAVEFLLGK